MTSVGSESCEELKQKNPQEAGEIKPERMSGRGSGVWKALVVLQLLMTLTYDQRNKNTIHSKTQGHVG